MRKRKAPNINRKLIIVLEILGERVHSIRTCRIRNLFKWYSCDRDEKWNNQQMSYCSKWMALIFNRDATKVRKKCSGNDAFWMHLNGHDFDFASVDFENMRGIFSAWHFAMAVFFFSTIKWINEFWSNGFWPQWLMLISPSRVPHYNLTFCFLYHICDQYSFSVTIKVTFSKGSLGLATKTHPTHCWSVIINFIWITNDALTFELFRFNLKFIFCFFHFSKYNINLQLMVLTYILWNTRDNCMNSWLKSN